MTREEIMDAEVKSLRETLAWYQKQNDTLLTMCNAVMRGDLHEVSFCCGYAAHVWGKPLHDAWSSYHSKPGAVSLLSGQS